MENQILYDGCFCVRRMCQLILYVAIVLTGLWGSAARTLAQPVLSIAPEGKYYYNLAPYAELYEDKTKSLTFADVEAPNFNGFKALNKPSLSAGYTESAYWFRFRIVVPPNHPLDWLLEVGYPNLQRLEFYLQREGRPLLIKKGGASEPFEQREFTSPMFVFALDDVAHTVKALPDTLTCYLRVETESAMIVPLSIYALRMFERLTAVEYLLYGFLYGVMAAMACYNLFLLVSVRERFYLYYVFYVATFLLGDIAIEGFGAIFAQSLQTPWMRILPFVMPLSSLCATLFARDFLHTAENLPTADKVLRGAIVLQLVVLALSFIVSYSVIVPVIAAMIGLVCTILIIVGIVSVSSGYRPARLFVAGWTIFLTASFLRSSATVGINSFTWWENHIPIVGAALENMLLSLALADRINLLKRRKAEELERAVVERTTELKAANEEISRQMSIQREQSGEIERTNTILHEKNAELIALNDEKNEFLGIVSHDLKNPIAGIRGMADILLSDESGMSVEQRQYFLTAIVNTSDRMFELVKNLLDVNAIERGGKMLNIVYVDVAPMVEFAVKAYENRSRQKNIAIRTINHCSENEAFVYGDENAIVQVLDNLLSNAVKYSPPGKEVQVTIVCGFGGFTRIMVQDEGPGLSEHDKTKLFGKFAQLSARPTAGEHSTGLGLSIVKTMVEAMNGRVWCESIVGSGATFIVELPAEKLNIQA
jgi:signal transduction histidine kinase